MSYAPVAAIDAARTELWRFDEGQRDGNAIDAILSAAWPEIEKYWRDRIANEIAAQERLPYAMQRYLRAADVRFVRAGGQS